MEQRKPNADECHCESCGVIIFKEAEICPKCGVRQSKFKKSSSSKSKLAAGLLALFLGGIGVHKFYLGQSGMGILYLCFCWTFIPALIGFIEGIIYLTMSDEDFAEKYQ
jgi:TM2 domain-containing membrane protein YozV